MSCCLFRNTRHEQAELLFSCLPALTLSRQPSTTHDEDAIRKRHDLLELDRDEKDPFALVAHGDQLAMDELDGADVDAAGRLPDEQKLGIALDLAREHDLLRVAAGEARRLELRLW